MTDKSKQVNEMLDKVNQLTQKYALKSRNIGTPVCAICIAFVCMLKSTKCTNAPTLIFEHTIQEAIQVLKMDNDVLRNEALANMP